MSKDNIEPAIFIADFENKCIREKVMMEKPKSKDYYQTDVTGIRHYIQSWYERDLRYYSDYVASRRSFPYPVSKEQDGKELREGKNFYFVDDEVPVDGDYKNGTGLAAIPINTDNENN